MNELRETTFEDLKRYSMGELVALPSFSDDMPLIVRLRRPNIMSLVKNGKIPNALLSSVSSLFNGKVDISKETDYSNMFEIVNIMCKEALISPTYEQFEEANIDLTIEQKMAIFNYTQEGVKALDSFRKK